MNKEILKKAIDTFGENAQQDMVIEECSELIKAILKYRRNNSASNCKNIIEEIADVEIMCEQLKMMFECEDEVNKQIEYKINRLKARLEQ